MIFGLVLIGVGVWFLVGRFVRIDTEILVPGVLIALGGALVVGALARSGNR